MNAAPHHRSFCAGLAVLALFALTPAHAGAELKVADPAYLADEICTSAGIVGAAPARASAATANAVTSKAHCHDCAAPDCAPAAGAGAQRRTCARPRVRATGLDTSTPAPVPPPARQALIAAQRTND
ncbi:hypothetical protein GH865_05965 [Rhodocyclus tenuis]|nr:hypothetical protein [Rhodocyclus gracilis]MRD72797.1 hypothetical protein [Rhodocyclus gracilis]